MLGARLMPRVAQAVDGERSVPVALTAVRDAVVPRLPFSLTCGVR